MNLLAWLWAAPISLFGLIAAAIVLPGGGKLQIIAGVCEATGGYAPQLLRWLSPWMSIGAITLGHVIVARDAPTAARLRAHEHVHVRQYARWGVFFPLAYAAASASAALRGECPYQGNAFEREAFASGQDAGRDQRHRHDRCLAVGVEKRPG